MTFRSVLCATDLSAGAAIALQYADELARYYRARFNVVFVSSDRERDDAVDALRQHVTETIGSIGLTDLWVEPGKPVSVIAEHAQALGADVIVLGSHGRSGIRAALLGSVVDDVLRHVGRAMLVARDTAPGPVVAATDFSEPAQRAVRAAAGEAKRRGVRLTLMHSIGVLNDPLVTAGPSGMALPPAIGVLPTAALDERRRDAEHELQRASKDLDVPSEAMAMSCDPVHDILEVAQARGAALIAMGRVGRTGLQRLLLGSVTEEIARSARCSVLAVP